MKKIVTLSLVTMIVGFNAQAAGRLEGGREGKKTETQTKERSAELNVLRPEVAVQGKEAQRTELGRKEQGRDRSVELGKSQSQVNGAQCQLNNFGGINTAAASNSGILQAGGCATNAEQKLSERAKAAAGSIANAAESVRQDLGVSLGQASNDQKAAIAAGGIQKFASLKGISAEEAAQDWMDVCEKCAVFHKAICSESVVAQAITLLSRKN